MIDVVDPSTEEVVARVAEDGAQGVDAAVRAARAALAGWAATALDDRLALLEAFAGQLEERAEELAQAIAREIGMPIGQARTVQVPLAPAGLHAAVAAARAFPFSEQDGPATIVREPAGVVAAITPWNFPLHQIVAKIGPALAAGCTVVLKPSELAPTNALLLAEAAREAGLPGGVLELVSGTGPVTGEALVAHPDVAVVSLTGSVRAGRRVGALAGAGLKRVCLELGGKSPSIVLDDADAEAAIRHSVSRSFLNSGQACNAPTRLLVRRDALADAEALAREVAEELVVGPAFEDGVTMGPVISADARDRVLGIVDAAARDGARLVTGGGAPARERGYFVAPTVFSDVGADSELAQTEVFGPVLAIQAYDDDDDAVRLANATPYGLSAEVWTADTQRARAVAARLRCGQVKVNGVRTRDALQAPFGGYGQSGVGRELGRFGLEELLEVKAVLGA
ncbi:MAG TPA: aldehyde dehydrogenase family protein [Baekduia sp.]|nr:aldehyde dehydrogenase family protein [Baekduia sp.]